MWEQVFPTQLFKTQNERYRAQLFYGLLVFLGIAFTGYIMLVRFASGRNFLDVAQTNLMAALSIGGFYLAMVITYLTTRMGNLTRGGIALLGMIFCIAVIAMAYDRFEMTGALAMQVFFMLLGAMLFRVPGLVGTLALSLAGYTFGMAARGIGTPVGTPSDNITDWIAGSMTLLAAAVLLYLYLRYNQSQQLDLLAEATRDRLKLADLTAQIARRIARRADLAEVLGSAVDEIVKTYPVIYHAQIFLIDEQRRNAHLVASTGEVGKLLLGRHHKLEVGGQSVIGTVTGSGEKVIARAGAMVSVHRRNEFLPDTLVEAAFPMRIDDRVIGTLDLQSKSGSAFSEQELPVFESLADSLAVAIDNARLFEETGRQLEQNQRLVDQAQLAVREVERMNQRLTAEVWQRYLEENQSGLGVTVDFEKRQTTARTELTSSLQDAIIHNQLVRQETENGQIISVPLSVRGQVIGAMEFEMGLDGIVSQEDIELIQQIGERMGLAAENTRLFEESQRVAQRELILNDISARLQASNNVESILNEAARSLKQNLNVGKVSILLGSPLNNASRGNGRS
jgi:GAF domain-containing protein